ncbi:MAG: GTP 3',8-cyclase MoaA [Planctomycetota bacterium]
MTDLTDTPNPRPLDRHARPLRNLRLSVTDRCNLRCGYCMPEAEYVWLPRAELLDFAELVRLVGVFRCLGVDAVRLTGGEPLLRKDLPELVAQIARAHEGVPIALTTNGTLLASLATELRAAGLTRITVSLDSLDPSRFARLSGRDALDSVLAGIAAARAAGFAKLKINTVAIRGENEFELDALLAFARANDAELRFIEYMDVGGATKWSHARVLGRAEILQQLAERHGAISPLAGAGSAPAQRFALPSGQTFGIIASTTAPFCRDCDRARLTADGVFFTCLYAREGLQLRDALRSGATDEELHALLHRTWSQRADRGAEERLALHRSRAAFASQAELRADPHLEMHTRGG